MDVSWSCASLCLLMDAPGLIQGFDGRPQVNHASGTLVVAEVLLFLPYG